MIQARRAGVEQFLIAVKRSAVTDVARIAIRPPELDEPARRLLWIIPAAIAIWAALLSGFSLDTDADGQAAGGAKADRGAAGRDSAGGRRAAGQRRCDSSGGAGDSSSEGRADRQTSPGRSREEGCAAAAGDSFSLRHREDPPRPPASRRIPARDQERTGERRRAIEEEGGGSGAESAPTRLARARFTRRRR